MGLPERQREAMKKIRYAPYPVVNVIFDRPVYSRGYDTWAPGKAFTDFVVADWVMRNQPDYRQKQNILTFYTPLPEAERARLLTEEGCRELAGAVLRDFQGLMPGFNVDPTERSEEHTSELQSLAYLVCRLLLEKKKKKMKKVYYRSSKTIM